MTNTKYGVISNHDEDFYQRFKDFCGGTEINEDNVNLLLQSFFENTLTPHISDYVINISGQCSAVPTTTPITFMGDIYNRTEENGIPVNWKENSNLSFANKLYNELGIDLIGELFAFLKKNDCRYHISFRMNDCHDSGELTSPLRGELFYMAKKYGWFVGEKYGYWCTCLDFSVKQVRDILLAYIEEQTMKYDAHGVEWDFTRELVCFDYLERTDCCEIMNDFLRDLKKTVMKAEEKWGHPIKINVRVGREISHNKIFGLDVKTWIDEKLVDSITVAPRFTITDSEMPISDWKELVKGTDVEIYAGIEMFTYNLTYNDDKAIAALTRKYLSQGADKIYLFNYFYMHINITDNKTLLSCTYPSASIENAKSIDARYILSGQDFGPLNAKLYNPYPIVIDGRTTYKINTSSYEKNQKMKVFVMTDRDDLSLTVNGVKAVSLADPKVLMNLPIPPNSWHAWVNEEIREKSKLAGFEVVCDASNEYQELEFSVDGVANIMYVELYFEKM